MGDAEAIRYADGLMDLTAEKPITRRNIAALFDVLISSKKMEATQAEQWIRKQRMILFPNVSDEVVAKAKKILAQYQLEKSPYVGIREVAQHERTRTETRSDQSEQ
jgi:hypothetical protein